ncbi:3-oxoadipate enol-lactonase [Sulfitobacter sp. M22]|uniref:3-oxoadipate enol-lactonase n=1 Tax=Sulfitobacter sp. M22 TaxID=2675332 RepID=UPI001F01EAA2|nr:3-oxoadipate enol-lactonase [Sulfitobacter sp. M22]MCF7728160.1 3-oxoadipate enol-lactonase [Sulfitobacter sp. M22]
MRRFLRLRGKVLHTDLRPGDGARPIVFLNSLGTDLRIWDAVMPGLPVDATILRHDKCGHGLSSGQSDSIADFAQDLVKTMDHLALSDALVVGLSIGGLIALQLADTRPDLVGGLILSNTSYRIGSAEMWQRRIDDLDIQGLTSMSAGVIERWLSPGFRDAHPVDTEGWRMMLARTPQAGYRAACAAIRDADLAAALPRLSCPVLCITGSDDTVTLPSIVADLARRIPGADLVTLEGVGHLPCLEVPDRVAELVSGMHGLLG